MIPCSKLPVPMYIFTPTITSDDHMLIVGYDAEIRCKRSSFKLPFTNIIASIDQKHDNDTSMKWTELTAANHWYTALVSSLSPPVVVGRRDYSGTITADNKMYDNSNKSWKKIGSLSSARSSVAVAAVYDNASSHATGVSSCSDVCLLPPAIITCSR